MAETLAQNPGFSYLGLKGHMKIEKTTKPIQFFVNAPMHKAAKRELLELDMSWQDLMRDLLSGWLEDRKHLTTKAKPKTGKYPFIPQVHSRA